MENIEGLTLVQYRRVALKCLDLIATSTGKEDSANDDDESNRDSENNIHTTDLQGDANSDQIVTSSVSATISLETWVPAIALLVDSQPGK